jgi:hypothetical protein
LPQLAFAPLAVDQHLDVGALGGAVGADDGHGRTVAAPSDADRALRHRIERSTIEL